MYGSVYEREIQFSKLRGFLSGLLAITERHILVHNRDSQFFWKALSPILWQYSRSQNESLNYFLSLKNILLLMKELFLILIR